MKRFHFVRTKNILFLSVLLAASGLFYSCEQETTSGETGETGTIEFKCINPFAEMQSPSQEAVRAAFENPPSPTGYNDLYDQSACYHWRCLGGQGRSEGWPKGQPGMDSADHRNQSRNEVV